MLSFYTPPRLAFSRLPVKGGFFLGRKWSRVTQLPNPDPSHFCGLIRNMCNDAVQFVNIHVAITYNYMYIHR